MKQKRKGYLFEKLLEKKLNEKFPKGKFRRIILSGAAGTLSDIDVLKGDVRGFIDTSLPNIELVFEAKAGYGGSKQISMKRDWFIQARNEIIESQEGKTQIPVVAMKFDKVKDLNIIIAMDLESFSRFVQALLNEIYFLRRILEEECDGKG